MIENLVLRTYNKMWKFERKIYAIDDIKLPIPINPDEAAYFVIGILLTLGILKLFPFLNKVPFIIRYIAIPYGLMKFLTKKKFDGKLPHKFLLGYIQFILSAKRVARFQDAQRYKKVRFTPVVYRKTVVINITEALTKMKKREERTMYQFPVKYYEDNILFNQKTNTCWACYRATGFNYDYLSTDRQISWLNRLSRFIANLGIESKILIIPAVQNVSEHYKELVSGLNDSDPLYRSAVAHAQGTEDYLLEKVKLQGNSNDYLVYILAKLEKKPSLSNMLDELFKRPMKVLEEFFGVDRKEILLSEIKYFQNAASAWYKEENKRLAMVKTDEKTTQWLYRRMYRRGLAEPARLREHKKGGYWKPGSEITIKDGEKAVRPIKRDILTLNEGLVEVGNRHIKVTNSDGKVSYQTFLTMSHIPDGLAFPGGEWLLLLQDYPFATEVCLHIKLFEFRESIKKITNKKQEIKSQIEHVTQNDNVPDELHEASMSADELERELKRNRAPLADVSISFCIAADNEREMDDNAKFLKERYEDLNFMIERAIYRSVQIVHGVYPGSGKICT